LTVLKEEEGEKGKEQVIVRRDKGQRTELTQRSAAPPINFLIWEKRQGALLQW